MVVNKETKEGMMRDFGHLSSDKRTFADVLEGRKQRVEVNKGIKGENICSMSWKRKCECSEWLDRCAVGVLRNFSSIACVNMKLFNRGSHFSSTYLGDKSVVWEFESRLDCDEFIRNHFIWKYCFSSMVYWTKSVLPKSRMVWLNCIGVPLRCWSKSFFRKISEPLVVDDDTLMRCRLDRGRLLALIPIGATILSRIKVVEDNHSFECWIFKDPIAVNQSWLVNYLELQMKSGIGGLNLNCNP
ncbi:hypothetical protein LWI28_005014 [Acer negundo]|uniref:DUF4283 domain-containing protein n=1 Tax=Acer negundo TaxID=4023 RepID=A0AAD5IZ23_ACENE|nr:hypothetical protein LWI28_005014 [Acer negundo]